MAAVELILIEDVEDLGKAGDKVSVAPGYARNYLLPKRLAEKITPGALRIIEARRERIEQERADALSAAQSLSAKIAEAEVTIPMQAGEDEHLFGSVNHQVIADALAELGIEVKSKNIKLAEPIKELGAFKVDIRLHSDVEATLKVWVVRA
jgi:large subunit ribosomal protein L9